MVKKIFLHMGMYHTGTTSLQNVLSQNPAELKERGIHFCMPLPLTYALHHECNSRVPLQGIGSAEEIFTTILRKAEEQGAHTLVLSHEGISYNPYYRNFTYGLGNTPLQCSSIASRIRKRLREILNNFDTKIVFYPRRQDHWVLANYCNAIWVNRIFTHTIDDIIKIADDCLCYARLMDKWSTLFGKESIVIRPYEKIQMPQGTLHDFCENILQCKVPETDANARDNVTPGKDCIFLFKNINRLFRDDNINSVIQHMVTEMPARDSGQLLGYQERIKILQNYAQENQRLAREYLQREDGRLFFEEAPTPQKYPAPDTIFTPEYREKLAVALTSRLEENNLHLDPGVLQCALSLPGRTTTADVGKQLGEEVFAVEDARGRGAPDIVVLYPDCGFAAERKYSIMALLRDIMGYTVLARPHSGQVYELQTVSGKTIMCVADVLFRQSDAQAWPRNSLAPQPPEEMTEPESGCSFPVFYGKAECARMEGVLHCAFDIFGMNFFMLSRLEEALDAPRDQFGRALPRLGAEFTHRPIVNEWGAFCASVLKREGISPSRRNRCSLHMTHDIDLLRSHEEEILWIAQQDHAHGLRSVFNFMGYPGNTSYDDKYFITSNAELQRVLHALQADYGHTIGFHPGFDSCMNRKLWRMQKMSLQNLVEEPITEGRQHYLKYAIPFTWRLFEENGLKTESGCGWPHVLGYRAGTASPFTAFDVWAGRAMDLTIFPLVCMDATRIYMQETYEKFFSRVHNYIDKSIRYSMPICLLFHNSFFYTDRVEMKKEEYVKILSRF